MNKIEFNCSACGTELRVDQEHAGKKARCPKCSMIHNVPGGTGGGGLGVGGPGAGGPRLGGNHGSSSHPGDMPTHVMGGKWELRGGDGQVYGPVDKPELDEWAGEGRISANCYLRQEGGEWFPAEQLYPQVSGAAPVSNPGGQGAAPFYVSDAQQPAGNPQVGGNPFAAPAQQHPYSNAGHPYSGQRGHGLRPHNGGAILTCGILGIICCGVFGIIAWVMGSKDLAAMKRGEMDRSGHGMVMAGYVMGIISCALMALGIILQVFLAFADGGF